MACLFRSPINMPLYLAQKWATPQPGLSPEPCLLHIYYLLPPKTPPQGPLSLSMVYAKVDRITSLSVFLAGAEILVGNAYFLQCMDMERKVGLDECGLAPFFCAFLPTWAYCGHDNPVGCLACLSVPVRSTSSFYPQILA